MPLLYWVALQKMPNFCNSLSGGPHENSNGILCAWHDYSELMHIMEFVSEYMSLDSLYTILTKLTKLLVSLELVKEKDFL